MAEATAASRRGQVRTYLAKYTQEPDALGGDYSHLYDRVNVGVATAEEVFTLAMTSSNIIPKVYLCMTIIESKPVVLAVHRPSLYEVISCHNIVPRHLYQLAMVTE